MPGFGLALFLTFHVLAGIAMISVAVELPAGVSKALIRASSDPSGSLVVSMVAVAVVLSADMVKVAYLGA